VVLCDRGFRRGRWLEHLQELRQAFVVRLVPDVMVTTGSRGARLLRAKRVRTSFTSVRNEADLIRRSEHLAAHSVLPSWVTVVGRYAT
jgi:hypothetical protein